MGVVTIGKEKFECRDVRLAGGSITMDSRVIYLCDNLTPIQVKGEKVYIIQTKSSGDIIVDGSVASALARKNMVVWGRVCRPSYGRDKFYNYTASEVFKESKTKLRQKSELGRRLVIRLSGEFNSLNVVEGNYAIETFLSGQFERVRSDKDIIMRGYIDGSRSDENTYISRLK